MKALSATFESGRHFMIVEYKDDKIEASVFYRDSTGDYKERTIYVETAKEVVEESQDKMAWTTWQQAELIEVIRDLGNLFRRFQC
jgi:hypothetical protein